MAHPPSLAIGLPCQCHMGSQLSLAAIPRPAGLCLASSAGADSCFAGQSAMLLPDSNLQHKATKVCRRIGRKLQELYLYYHIFKTKKITVSDTLHVLVQAKNE